MISADQLQLFERDVKKLSATSWLSESMPSQIGKSNKFIYTLDQGMNDLCLDFNISVFQDSGDHDLMFEGKIYWNGALKSISYLSLGNSRTISTGIITIDGNTWHSQLKWIEPDGQTKHIKDSSTFNEDTFESYTEAADQYGDYTFVSKKIWQKI